MVGFSDALLSDFFSSLARARTFLLYALTISGTRGRPAVTKAAGEEIRCIGDDDVDDEAAFVAELCDGAEALDGALLRDDAEARMGALALCRATMPQSCLSLLTMLYSLEQCTLAGEENLVLFLETSPFESKDRPPLFSPCVLDLWANQYHLLQKDMGGLQGELRRQ